MNLHDMRRLPAHLIRRAHQLSTSFFADELAAFDLTAVQYATLVAVASLTAPDMTRVSEAIGFDKATLGSVVDRLEAKQWVRREPSSSDRRLKLLRLTDEGAALLVEVEPRVRVVQEKLMARLSPAQRSNLIGALAALLETP